MKTLLNSIKNNKWINKYTLTTMCFAIWITFLDGKFSIMKQVKLNRQVAAMQKTHADYIVKLEEAKAEYNDLISNPEKYAREKYFISKPGEEVYIIE